MNKNINLYYKNYNLQQAFYRSKISTFRRNFATEKKNIFWFSYNIFIKLISERFLRFFLFTQKRNLDVMVISNTNYKIQKLLNLFKGKNYKIGILADHQNQKSISKKENYFFIKKIFFYGNNNFKDKHNILINKLHFFEKIINFYKPKSIYLIEGDSPSESLISEICKVKNIKCYCLQHGMNFPLIVKKKLSKSELTNIKKFCSKNNLKTPIINDVFSKFFFPGFFYNFIFLSYSKKTVDFLKKNKLIKESIIIKKKIKFKILFKKKTNIVFGVPTLVTKEKLDKKVFYNLANMINYFSKYYPDKKIIVRLHPSGKSTKILLGLINKTNNIDFHDPAQKTLEESFSNSQIAFFVYGTSLVSDAIEYGTIPLVLQNNSIIDYSFLKKLKLVYVFKDLNRIKIFGKQLVDNFQYQKKWKKKIFTFLSNYYKK